MNKPRQQLLALTILGAFGIAGCGADDSSSSSANVKASGSTATTSDAMAGMSKTAGGSMPETMRMQKVATATKGDMSVELDTMSPQTFEVSQGTRLLEHAPRKKDTAHLMVVLSDSQSHDRLPDATITAQIKNAKGRVIYQGPQYAMLGMGMGLHYGDNVPLPAAGHYTANLVVGPPAIGRHQDTANRWRHTVRFAMPFKWAPEQ